MVQAATVSGHQQANAYVYRCLNENPDQPRPETILHNVMGMQLFSVSRKWL